VAEREEVLSDQFADERQQICAGETGELLDTGLAVEAHAVRVSHRHEEQVEGGCFWRKPCQPPLAHETAVEPGEAEAAGSGDPADPVRAERGMTGLQPAACSRAFTAHRKTSRPRE
jgi:hypothetical protein